MKFTIFGLEVSISRIPRLNPKEVVRIALMYSKPVRLYSWKIYLIKAVRTIDPEMKIKEARMWVEKHFGDYPVPPED